MSFIPSCNVSVVPSIVLTAARQWAAVGGYTPAHKTAPADCEGDQWDSFFESHCETTKAIEDQDRWLSAAQEGIDPPLLFDPPRVGKTTRSYPCTGRSPGAVVPRPL